MAGKVQYEVGLSFPVLAAGGEVVRLLLSANGFDVTGLVEQLDKERMSYSFFHNNKKAAERALARFRSLRLCGARVFLRKHVETDWSSRWKKGWRPFALTKRFHVVPLWQGKRDIPKQKEPIFLETTNAFGTGLHETTRFVAEMIEGLQGEFDSFLDVGTGTGILAIVALKCGAGRAVAFDIDPSAVKVARDNLKANHLSCQVVAADIGRYKTRRTFDVVAANLVSPDLIEFRDRIISCVKPGGALIVSGISLQNFLRVKKAFGLPSIKLVRVTKGREWAAILFRLQGGE